MLVEELTAVICKEAADQIAAIHEVNPDRGLTWAQTDALGDVRSELRYILAALSGYAEDLPREEALLWLWKNLDNDPQYPNEVVEGLMDHAD